MQAKHALKTWRAALESAGGPSLRKRGRPSRRSPQTPRCASMRGFIVHALKGRRIYQESFKQLQILKREVFKSLLERNTMECTILVQYIWRRRRTEQRRQRALFGFANPCAHRDQAARADLMPFYPYLEGVAGMSSHARDRLPLAMTWCCAVLWAGAICGGSDGVRTAVPAGNRPFTGPGAAQAAAGRLPLLPGGVEAEAPGEPQFLNPKFMVVSTLDPSL